MVIFLSFEVLPRHWQKYTKYSQQLLRRFLAPEARHLCSYAMKEKSSSVRSEIWWGEATDEPARADARPTEYATPTGLGRIAERAGYKDYAPTELNR